MFGDASRDASQGFGICSGALTVPTIERPSAPVPVVPGDGTGTVAIDPVDQATFSGTTLDIFVHAVSWVLLNVFWR